MFVPSVPKHYITRVFDRELLEHLHTAKGRKLRYFGLPGPIMADIFEWHDLLEDCLCIEYDEAQKDLLIRAAFLSGLPNKTMTVKADVEDFITTKLLASRRKPFDVANLDYFGPAIIAPKEGRSAKQEALRTFFQFQRTGQIPEQFALLLTANLRNKDDGQIAKMLADIERQLPNRKVPSPDAQGYLKMKIVVPYLVRHEAAQQLWDLELRYSLTYVGTSNVRMVHFGFLASPTKDMIAQHTQSLEQVYDMPMFEVRGESDERVSVDAIHF